ncbi:hypothetical protein C809_03937 [Lachnospiraceae bacterium MD335]|nr:hypothetical protein C809_03937 [Lachnospiraceae bacterium MD335]
MKIYWNGTSKNIIGSKIRQLWQEKGLFQTALAAILAKYFNISTNTLLEQKEADS